MDAPRDATMGSPLLVPFDGSAHAESVFPYLALLADGERDIILLQVVPEAQSLSSPMGEVMLSANELRQATETAARADLDRAAAQLASVAPSLRIEQLVETGDPSQRISEVALRCRCTGNPAFESGHQRDRARWVRDSCGSSCLHDAGSRHGRPARRHRP